jgi:hypothetical protein
MNIQQFLQHHGIARNPFAEEDAQTDPVFKEHCIDSAYHPVWDKVYGDPAEPGTSIVFGMKGAGKTAMRLQIERHLQTYNRTHPDRRTYIIRYFDFNPFLDQFCSRLPHRVARNPEKALQQWQLWDHMDAILCLGVTDLVDRILGSTTTFDGGMAIAPQAFTALDASQKRDLLLLALAYDQSTQDTVGGRWHALRRRLGYRQWFVQADKWLGILLVFGIAVLGAWLWWHEDLSATFAIWTSGILGLIVLSPFLWRWVRCQWMAWQVHRMMRVGKRDISSLRKLLLNLAPRSLASQPLPRFERTDDRYALLAKFQGILRTLGFPAIIVLIDRVDEPHVTAGRNERMRLLVWPLLDNKLLKHPGVGFKLLLPQELYRDIERESGEFHERARLDKQNVIAAFAWTGEALYDLARARMQACALPDRSPEPHRSPEPRDLFSGVSFERLIAAFQGLRVPRHLFRFLYRAMVEHCNKHTDAQPQWQIDSATFESTLALYYRDMESTGV